jgi:Domain of unknown function (DUF5666)
MNKTKLTLLAGGMMAIGLFISVAGSAFAASNKGTIHRRHASLSKTQSVSGTVSAISGSTLTVLGSNGIPYTVDASNAKITKLSAPATGTKPTQSVITVAGILTGDTLRAQGTLNGTTLTATSIMDGVLGNKMGGFGKGKPNKSQTGNVNEPQRQGVSGTVSTISGSTLTLTGKNGTTYTVDATNAKIGKFTAPTTGGMPVRTDIQVTDIAIGDTLKVQGTLNGTTLTATSIMDGIFGLKRDGQGNGKSEDNPAQRQGVSGTVSAISGSSITLLGKDGKTTYMVDATNATISKFSAPAAGGQPVKTPITVADIKVGDTLRVQGTLSGTSVTATQIMDGLTGGRGMGGGFGTGHWKNGKSN